MAKKQKFPHLLGSKWTANKKTFGWRHFQVVNRKNQGPWVYAELVSSCDRSVRFWINAKMLKDKSQWQPGWTPLNELAIVDEAEMLDDGTLQILPVVDSSKDDENKDDKKSTAESAVESKEQAETDTQKADVATGQAS